MPKTSSGCSLGRNTHVQKSAIWQPGPSWYGDLKQVTCSLKHEEWQTGLHTSARQPADHTAGPSPGGPGFHFFPAVGFLGLLLHVAQMDQSVRYK